MSNIEFEDAKFKAIKYIGISKKTKYEVYQKLVKSGYGTKVICEVIDYLIDIKYLDDLDYVKSFIRQNIKMLRYSIFEITQKLKIKGININDYIKEVEVIKNSNYEKDVISKLYLNKFKNMDEISIKRYLFRRGFTKIDF